MRSTLLLFVVAMPGCIAPPPSGAVSSTDSGDVARGITDVGGFDDGIGVDAGGRLDAAREALDASGNTDAQGIDAAEVNPDVAPSLDMAAPRYRLPIAVNAGLVGAPVVDFPLLVDIVVPDVPGGRPTEALLSFTDSSGAVLPHEVETYAPLSGALRAWVLLPSLSSTASTIILDFEGRPNAPLDVWNQYHAVWHMSAAANGAYPDATGRGNAATLIGAPQSAAGQVGNAVEFDGMTQALTVARSADSEPQRFTISFWALVPSPIQAAALVTKSFGTTESYQIWVRPSGAGFELFAGGAFDGRTSIPFPADTWMHVAYSYDGASMTLFIDGQPNAFAHSAGGPVDYDANPLYIGADTDSGVIDDYFPGLMDEVRIARTALSAQRLDAERRNQADPASFYTVGALEAY